MVCVWARGERGGVRELERSGELCAKLSYKMTIILLLEKLSFARSSSRIVPVDQWFRSFCPQNKTTLAN